MNPNTSMESLLSFLIYPLEVFWTPGLEFFWACLLASIPVAVIAYLLNHKGNQSFTWMGFLKFLAPADIYKHRSTWVTIQYWYSLSLLSYVYMVPLKKFIFQTPLFVQQGMSSMFGAMPDHGIEFTWAMALAITLVTFLAYDFAIYIVHYAFHKVPVLWELHKVHHSATRLNPIVTLRQDPVMVILMITGGIVGPGFFTGVTWYVFHGPVGGFKLFGMNALIFLFFASGGLLRHTHVWLHWGRVLNHVLYSPAHHQIHHSEDPRHWGKNIGVVTSIWDWLFGTLYVPGKREAFTIGLANQDETTSYERSVWSLYTQPWRNIWKRFAQPALRSLIHPSKQVS